MDEKQKKLLIITVILIPIFIFALFSSIRKIRQRYAPATNISTPALQLPDSVTAPKLTSPADAAVKKNEDLDWIRCPFCGKIYSGRDGGLIDLKLTGIIWDNKRPQALINGAIVSEGETIGNFKVLKIYKDKVKMASDGTYFEIRLEQ